MKYATPFGFVLGFIGSLAGCLICRAEAPQTNALADGNTAFACDLYARLKTTPGNLFFSPYSISSCLAMTYAGARGNTESQMARVLHFGPGQEQVHTAFALLKSQLKQAEAQKGIELNVANALWTQQGHPFLPAFLQVARQQYDAELKQADFKTGADAATREINQWVSAQTRDKIQNILAPGTLNAFTRIVLANAIYFKGAWASQFAKSSTRPLPFHLSPTSQADAPFMYQAESVKYFENDTLQVVELPYFGGELSMVILLPRPIDGCAQLENLLNPANLAAWVGQLGSQTKVEIFIPRFKLESSFSLEHVLLAMGMADAFSQAADFSAIDAAKDLFISSVTHKAWGEVNEEGTEAAASTVVGVSRAMVEKPTPPPHIFRADHPFLFLIRDTRSGTLLFLGRLAEPKS